MENISCLIPKNEMDLQLDFIFTSVYIGKIKGASKGCVTVSIYIFSLVLLLGKVNFQIASLVQMKMELILVYIGHFEYVIISVLKHIFK